MVTKEQSENLNRLDRRGVGGIRKARHYKEFSVEENKPVTYSNPKCNKVYTSYSDALDMVNTYYDEWGYEPTLKYLRGLNSSGTIPLLTRVKIQDIITDRYLTPTPRALIRRFNKQEM